METKKNKKVDLELKRSLHFTIGLVISITLVTTAFEWRTAFDPHIDITQEAADDAFAPIKMPVTIHEPPKPKKIVLPEVIESVDDDVELDDDMEFVLPTFDDPVSESELFEGPTEEKADEIHITAEVQPSFPGGLEGFYQYIGKNLKYPRKATQQNIQGKVFIQFVVDRDGSLSDLQVVKGIGGGCDEEALRVIKNSPKWNPGKQRGQAVRVRMTIPITFKLQ